MIAAARLLPLALLVAALCAGCQRDASETSAAAAAPNPATAPEVTADPQAAQPSDDVRSNVPSKVEMPPATAPTPEIAVGAEIVYSCDDGSELRVAYAGNLARIAAPDGSPRQLTRVGSDQGGEMYSDRDTSLHRLANVVELKQGARARRCSESGGSA